MRLLSLPRQIKGVPRWWWTYMTMTGRSEIYLQTPTHMTSCPGQEVELPSSNPLKIVSNPCPPLPLSAHKAAMVWTLLANADNVCTFVTDKDAEREYVTRALLLLLLCSPCPLGMLGGICLVLVTPGRQSYRLVGLVVMDDLPPFCTVLDCFSPVPYATKVIIDQVSPAQGCSTWRSFISTWSASHKLSLGAKGWHPPNMSKPLQSSLSQLFLHW